MAFRLPPLNTLRIFEAAARHKSFKQAADELNITASAVSHGMQTLEDWLGTELFIREARGLRLTPAGEAYSPTVTQALNMLANATDQLPGRKETGALVVSSAPTFAQRWLLPRLSQFTNQFPEIRVSIDTSRRFVDLRLDGVDAAIRMAPDDKSASKYTLLVKELFVPVCSPAMKEQFPGLSAAEILARGPLIHVTTVSSDWREWFRLSGEPLPQSVDRGLRVDSVQMAFDAAAQGLGIVLGRKPVADDDLASGRLVEAFDQTLPSGKCYWLVAADTNFEKPEVKLFREWMISQLRVAPMRRPRPG